MTDIHVAAHTHNTKPYSLTADESAADTVFDHPSDGAAVANWLHAHLPAGTIDHVWMEMCRVEIRQWKELAVEEPDGAAYCKAKADVFIEIARLYLTTLLQYETTRSI